jgi:hypothetical protein
MFRRFNKNVPVSDGQLYAMSEEDSVLVQEAVAFLDDPHYPLRTKITDLMFDTIKQDGDQRQNLSTAVAIVSGCLHGVRYISRVFDVQEDKLNAPVDRQRIVDMMNILFDMFSRADVVCPLVDGRRRRGRFNLGKFIGPMLYDIIENIGNLGPIREKWVSYLTCLHDNAPRADEANVPASGGANNINPSFLKRISAKVAIYVNEGGRIATKEELQNIRHPADVQDDVSDDGDEIAEN